LLLGADLLSIDEVVVIVSHGQRSPWHADHAVQVIVHVEDLLLLRVQVVAVVRLSLVDHCEPHVAWHEDVVAVALRRRHGRLNVVAVV